MANHFRPFIPTKYIYFYMYFILLAMKHQKNTPGRIFGICLMVVYRIDAVESSSLSRAGAIINILPGSDNISGRSPLYYEGSEKKKRKIIW